MVTSSRAARPEPHRWLLLVHLLPATPSNLRVRTWRRLQQIGAIAIKQSVYLLPDSAAAREDFEWLKNEIAAAGGEATVFAADSVDAWTDDEIVEEFRRVRQGDYAELERGLATAVKRLTGRKAPHGRGRGRDVRQVADGYRQRFADLQRIDFFGSPGRERVGELLARLEERTSPEPEAAARQNADAGSDRASYRKRLWVTRPRPGVDRMAAAWLIRRFIDPDAAFSFVDDVKAAPPGSVPFDMFGVDLSHHGEHCTFETLCARFDIRDPAVAHLAGIVHDLDLKDGRFAPPEAPAIGQIIEGMQLACDADDALLAQGVALFEALYQSLARSARPASPRPAASRKRRRRRPSA